MSIKKTILLVLGLVLIWSAVNPLDYFKWVTGILPVIIGFGIIWAVRNRYRFTNFTFFFIGLYSSILIIGAHFTYSNVPFFSASGFNGDRHYFENMIHFLQGFIPALIVREVLLRRQILNRPKWMTFITICICIAINATYELVEWFVKEISTTAANVVWENNVYQWDTEPNLLLATIGATSALIILSTSQDKAIRNFRRRKVRFMDLDEKVSEYDSSTQPKNNPVES